MTSRQAFILVCTSLAMACQGTTGPRSGDLITPTSWQSVDLSADPFADLRPEDSTCDARGIKFEEGVLEIDTGLCGYYTGSQPLATDVYENDTLSWLIYHGALAASEPTVGYVALQIGDVVVFEREVPIPYSSRIYAETITADFDAPAGTLVYFHVHNHGANSWRMAHIRLNEEP